ncbi:hypothetical protein EV383_4392 [Pseudonocardia sediminis]|uniref:Minor structural protein GP20 n=1 Tax=Pseudonocardia sediminis TaxID=1397368 RepID=A0A4Q7V1Y9_PSEST|nr:hypothetical protein [Pseudonocardia sediminis]RZT87468.1 hypothetical protein EV383_4392 [Pseudonocardia sediminis]
MKNNKRFSALLLTALAEGEGGSGGGAGNTAAATTSSAEQAESGDESGGGSETGTAGKPSGPGQNHEGRRDADPEGSGKPAEQKPGGDTSKLERTLQKEREDRKTAEQAVKDKQAEVERAAKAHQDLMDNLAVALGVKKGDAPPDPEALQRAVAERDARLTEVSAEKDREVQSREDTIRQQRVELAAWRIGSDPKLGANVAAVLDSRRVADSIKDMDPASDSFEKDLAAVIKSAVDGNEAYRSTKTAAPASDAGIGATGNGTQPGSANATPGVGRMAAAFSESKK